MSAVIGSTVSKLSGGKFANGAQTAVFQYRFNQVGNFRLTTREEVIKRGVTDVKEKYKSSKDRDALSTIVTEGTYVYEVTNEDGTKQYYTDGKVNYNAVKFTDTNTGSFGGAESAPSFGWFCGMITDRIPFDRVSDAVYVQPENGNYPNLSNLAANKVTGVHIWSVANESLTHLQYQEGKWIKQQNKSASFAYRFCSSLYLGARKSAKKMII